MQADERARAEEQKREKADAATAAHNALRESEADKFKAAVAATEAFTASTERKHVRAHLLLKCGTFCLAWPGLSGSWYTSMA